MFHWRMTRGMLALAGVLWISAAAAQNQNTIGSAPPPPGIGLTVEHKRTIYREVGHERAQRIPEGSAVAIGAEVPDSVILNEMPVSVKDQIGLLRDFKFARLPDDNIVIVDPAKRQIVDIVTKKEGGGD